MSTISKEKYAAKKTEAALRAKGGAPENVLTQLSTFSGVHVLNFLSTSSFQNSVKDRISVNLMPLQNFILHYLRYTVFDNII